MAGFTPKIFKSRPKLYHGPETHRKKFTIFWGILLCEKTIKSPNRLRNFAIFSYNWSTNFVIFFPQLVDKFCNFFSYDQSMNFLIFCLWLIDEFRNFFTATNWQNSQFFHDWLGSFTVSSCDRLMKFKIFLLWETEIFRVFFLWLTDEFCNISSRQIG